MPTTVGLHDRHALAQPTATKVALCGRHKLTAITYVCLLDRHALVSSDQIGRDMSALEVYLSGGSSNSDPLLSIGDRVSSESFTFQTYAQASALSGVTVIRTGNNATGAGVLSYERLIDGTYLFRWVPESSDSRAGRVISDSGRYGLVTSHGVGTGFIVVDVDFSSLSPGGESSTVYVRNAIDTLFSEVTKEEAFTGMTDYRCFYIKNAHTSKSLTNGKLGVLRTSGLISSLAVATDFAGAGDGTTQGVATTPADRFTSPGFSFGQETPLPTLAPGQYVAVWVRRTIPAGWFTEGVDSNLLLVSGGF